MQDAKSRGGEAEAGEDVHRQASKKPATGPKAQQARAQRS
jgi:hypothetical protein